MKFKLLTSAQRVHLLQINTPFTFTCISNGKIEHGRSRLKRKEGKVFGIVFSIVHISYKNMKHIKHSTYNK